MRKIPVSILFISAVLFSGNSFADLYKWTDDKGVVHMTDNIDKVPEKYYDRMKTYKSSTESTPAIKQPETARQPAIDRQQEQGRQEVELYGDYPLEWWREEFANRRKEIKELESSLNAKRQYISVFEAGRRLGQSYPMNEFDTYERYKKDLPSDEERLLTLKSGLEELERKAKFHGVPKEAREGR